ncbi:MAG TPA: VCBS repeat-containing protein [Chitinophagaceae bacterium]
MKKLLILFCTVIVFACNEPSTLFVRQSSSHTGIKFNNQVIENDSVNPIDLEFLYNGGGVAVGDFNNDGLQDLYFTGSEVSNKLYLNKGDFKFNDVTNEAHVTGEGRWCNGATVADVNSDGLPDIYVCATIKKNPEQRKNLLYINQGINKEGVPLFKEMSVEYNLADTGYSVQAAFFDYDNDGDLDMYLLQTKLAQRDVVQFTGKNSRDTTKTDIDKLYRNDWSDSLKHPVFTDVSKEAGITDHGYGLGLNIVDINNDGWKDIYATNDFFGNDLLYINNHDGTFTNKTKDYFKHTSRNAMGNDVADINNDGLPDVVAVDMDAEDNFRKKKNMDGNNYYLYQRMMSEGLIIQYVRNTLQLNMGPRVSGNDSVGDPIFADVGYYAGVAETDWSWNPSVADFDNDGYKDIFITNGYPRDVTDHDFVAFRNKALNIASKEQLIEQMPQIKISNYAFQNRDSLHFENMTKQWGLNEPSFSNGAVYVDLDNDGDLDYVVNNINDEAFVYKNTVNSKEKVNAGFLKVKFKGEEKNLNGLGAIATIYYDKGRKQMCENAPSRGYLSCVENSVQFGLKNIPVADSVIIQWPGNKVQKLANIKANQVLEVSEKNAADPTQSHQNTVDTNSLFTDVTLNMNVRYRHSEMDFIDFNIQRLLPHKLSEYGPGIAAGDIDGNGYDDLCIGGTGDFPVKFLLQQPNGKFIEKNLPFVEAHDARRPENEGVLLFDADNDGDPDLYLTSGSDEFPPDTKNYQDRFFENDGTGNFTFRESALPVNYTSKSCIKAVDFDNDGDLDLFIGGRVIPGRYPEAVSSFIYRNDSKKGEIKFTDVTASVAPGLQNVGLTCDAIWTDFDNDGWKDLILAGEWMPVTFFKNVNGRLQDVTGSTGLDSFKGWWNSIAAGDFDNDGDIDYVAGNLGSNSYYRASEQHPVRIYAGDFAHNNSYVAIPSLYLPDEKGNKEEFPAQTRDDIVDPLPALKKKFLTYKEFGKAGIGQLLDEKDFKTAYKLEANYMQSVYMENLGNGKFKMHALPVDAQLAPVYGMVIDDFNGDGNLDIAAVGNDYGTEVSVGRYDAMNGLIMLGNGRGNFACETILQSGLFIPGNAKAVVKLIGNKNNYLLAASQNKDVLKVYRKRNNGPLVQLLPTDVYAVVYLKNGTKRKEEIYHGTSFLSQSSLFIPINNKISAVEIINNKGEKRRVSF